MENDKSKIPMGIVPLMVKMEWGIRVLHLRDKRTEKDLEWARAECNKERPS